MRLKKIVIQGFKSFADKTTVLFDGGIIAIVGPNGCGKSNIADAFRWVLGEQSAKSMRSPKMPDVIFSGTSDSSGKMKRKPLNFAEVSITLTEVQGKLPTEFEEVEITRRLHRSGESDYFINRQSARLKDIQDLISGSGIGRNAISIFEQGKIDQVIQLSPEDRRAIFEEVAGTSLFIKRKQETLRRLSHTDQNLLRLKDIYSEVEKQKELYEKQAEKALVYQDKRKRHEALDKALIVSKWRQFKDRLMDVEGKRTQHMTKMESALASFNEREEKLKQARALLEEREQVLLRKKEAVYETKSQREVKEQTHKMNAEKFKEALEKQKTLSQELSEVRKKQESFNQEAKVLEKEQKAHEQQLSNAEKELRGERKSTKDIETDVAKLREQQISAQRERLRLVQMESHAEGEWKQTRVRLESFHERLDQTKLRLSQLLRNQQGFEKTVKERREEMDAVSSVVDHQKGDLKKAEAKLNGYSQEVQELEKKLRLSIQEMTEFKARQKVLYKLREEMQGFSSGTKTLLQEAKNAKSPIAGLVQGLYELFAVEVNQQAALTVAMRPYAQTLVVKNDQDLKKVLAFASQKGIKDFSLISLEHLSEDSKAVEGTLLSKGQGSPLARHFLKNITVVDSVEEAMKKKAGACCFGDEAYIDHFRVLFYPSHEQSNVFQRENELKQLVKQIEASEKEIVALEKALHEAQEAKRALQAKTIEADKQLRKEEMKLVEVNFGLQRAQQDLERSSKEQKQLEEEVRGLEKGITDLKGKLENLALQHETAKKQAADMQKLHIDTESELEERIGVMRKHQRETRDRETTYQQLVDRNQEMIYKLNLLQMRSQEADQLIQKIQREIDQCEQFCAKMQGWDKTAGQEIQQVEETLQKFTEACQEEDTKVQKQKELIAKLEKEIQSEREKERDLIEKKNQFEVSLSECNTTCRALENELEERHQLKIDHPVIDEIVTIEDLKEGDRELKALRRSIEDLGAVNMTAIEEREQHLTRYEYLSKQISDLETTKAELQKIISDLEEESRKLFQETFDLVRVNFKKNFEILFQGGEADLQLIGEKDVLAAGIEIIAKPPGKQMRSIQLLSGGEKCMTALALLFAIFEVKPAPFSILDEIDAPLDDSNIERFVNVLKQFIDHCQFIIITHNKRTMAIADMLYGVTMEEKGVSKLLSIEFNRDAHFEEPHLVEV